MAASLANTANNVANNAPLLKDIHLPDSPGFWPLAPGWWILLALLFILSAWLILKLIRIAKQRKYQQIILDQYTVLEQNLLDYPDNKNIAAINIFLRQLAVNQYPRADIASLTGVKWLKFLDQSGSTQGFTSGAGKILAEAPYRSGRVERLNMTEFKPLIRSWIKKTSKTGGGGYA